MENNQINQKNQLIKPGSDDGMATWHVYFPKL